MTLAYFISAVNGKSKGEVGKEEGRKEDEGVEIGVLDVVRAMTPLLVIIAVALGMLVVGYMFVPETLSPQNCECSTFSVSVCRLLRHLLAPHGYYIVGV